MVVYLEEIEKNYRRKLKIRRAQVRMELQWRMWSMEEVP